MRNVTITLEEEVARWVRVRAAEADTSVSRWVGELLSRRMRHDAEYEEAMERFLARPPKALSGGCRYPSRDEVHER